MEINIPNLLNAALPARDTQGRSAIILSQNTGSNHNEQGFLSSNFPRSPRKLFITAEGDEFDEETLQAWRAEGFQVQYFGLGDNTSDDEYRMRLSSLRSEANLGPCETFGIVAFGDAAALCLEFFHHMDNNPDFKLGCIVAYYPSRVPDVRAVFPGGVRVLVHLPRDDEIGVVMHGQIAGFQGKRRVVKKTVGKGRAVSGAGVAVGGNACAYPCYRYDAPAGFAENDLDEYDTVAADLAWSRSLNTVHTAFRMDIELEGVVEQNLEGKFVTRNLQQTMATYTTHKPPHTTYFPTLSGGIGAQELQRFYAEYFLATNPESTKLTLVSRTSGADRVVDEIHVSFKHTQEMPWILPGVPATNKRVEVAIVSIVTLRGGKLFHEHVYWDQASVLVQVGLLDPKVVPEKARDKGVKRLPVVGREAARRLVHGFEDDQDGEGEADNELLPGWYDDDGEEVEEKEEKPRIKRKSSNKGGNVGYDSREGNGTGNEKQETAEARPTRLNRRQSNKRSERISDEEEKHEAQDSSQATHREKDSKEEEKVEDEKEGEKVEERKDEEKADDESQKETSEGMKDEENVEDREEAKDEQKVKDAPEDKFKATVEEES